MGNMVKFIAQNSPQTKNNDNIYTGGLIVVTSFQTNVGLYKHYRTKKEKGFKIIIRSFLKDSRKDHIEASKP